MKHLLQEGRRRHRRRGGDRRQVATVRRGARAWCSATGGFDWAPDTCRDTSGRELIGAPRTNTGDGQRMAAEAGAELDRMDQAKSRRRPSPATRATACPAAVRDYAAALHPGQPPRPALRQRGQRLAGVGARRARARRQTEHLPVWRIFDAQFAPATHWRCMAGEDLAFVRKRRHIAALARSRPRPRCPRATVERFNGFVEQGVDQDFRRGETAWERYGTAGTSGNPLGTVAQAPFYAAPCHLRHPRHQGRTAHQCARTGAAAGRQRDRGALLRGSTAATRSAPRWWAPARPSVRASPPATSPARSIARRNA